MRIYTQRRISVSKYWPLKPPRGAGPRLILKYLQILILTFSNPLEGVVCHVRSESSPHQFFVTQGYYC
jgi:hypothetical protein